MKIFLLATTGMLLFTSAVGAADKPVATPAKPQVYVERFDGKLSPMAKALIKKKYVDLVDDEGVRGSKAVKVTYQGYEQGSHRITATGRLSEPALKYKLNFSVKFCENFDFVMGGKLHGLAPLTPVTGGHKVKDSTWSARLMFERDGGLKTYIYHQDMKGKFGDSVKAQNFRFKPGQYHRIQILLSLNTAADKADGKMLVSADGVEVIRHENIRFRKKISDDTLISKLLFNTFHGGASPQWAPRTKGKGYNAECAYFDNFIVSKVF